MVNREQLAIVKITVNDNDNDKRLGLTAKADQPDRKKYSTLKIKMDNEAVQKLHTSQNKNHGIKMLL